MLKGRQTTAAHSDCVTSPRSRAHPDQVLAQVDASAQDTVWLPVTWGAQDLLDHDESIRPLAGYCYYLYSTWAVLVQSQTTTGAPTSSALAQPGRWHRPTLLLKRRIGDRIARELYRERL